MTDYMRDTDYWNNYYQNKSAPLSESQFANYVLSFIDPGKTIIDCGCGNGRDALFFHKNGLIVTAVDASDKTIEQLNSEYKDNGIQFSCDDFVDSSVIWNQSFDYVYSRFTLHAITKQQEDIFLKNVYNSLKDSGKLFIEVRSIHDELFGKGIKLSNDEFYYNDHYRRFLNIDILIKSLNSIGYTIKYAEEKKGFAKYMDQDPQIIRIIAQK